MMTPIIKTVIVIISLAMLFTLLGCGKTTRFSSTSEMNADDILSVPGGGPAYRANVHESGVDNPWPEIKSVTVTLDDPVFPAEITYRDSIESSAGKTVNNIIQVVLTNIDMTKPDTPNMAVNIQTVDLPDGMNANISSAWYDGDPERRNKVVVSIKIVEQVQPGEYTFGFDFEINCKDYGRVPCTIKVVLPD